MVSRTGESITRRGDLRRITHAVRFPYFVLFFSLLLTLGATLIFYQSAKSKDQNRFNASVNRVRFSLENRVGLYFALLKAGRGFVESSEKVDRQRFHEFIQNLEVERNYHGAQGIGYTRTIDVARVPNLIAEVRAQGIEDFVVGPMPASGVVQPIIYIEPDDERNRRVLGFNMSSESRRREAMEVARDTGAPTATGRVRLMQDSDDEGQYGFLIYLPVYRGAPEPTTVEERRAALDGFIYSPFRATNFLADVQDNAGSSDLVISLYDGAPTPENFLTQTPLPQGQSPAADFDSVFTTTSQIDFAGRRWSVKFDSLPSFGTQSSVGWTPLILLCGLITSLLLFGMVYWEASTRAKLEKTASDLAESERQIQSLYEKEQTARQIAERANSTKDEFISVVSHELRTPLNAIAGWARILRSDDLSESTRRLALQKVENNLRLQTTLVDELLSYSQMIAGHERLQSLEIDIGELFRAVLAEFREPAARKGVELACDDRLDGQKVLGDPDKLRIVFVNLLSNALKFTPVDGRVEARLFESDGCANVCVADSGRGIDPEFLPRIFERFSQYDSSTTRRYGGLGLGLAVSERIVRMHDGRIEAISEGEGKGSTFSVSLPVYVPSAGV